MKVLGKRLNGRESYGQAASAHASPFLFDELPFRFTKELDRTARLAVMLAKSRALEWISAADFLAAMYLNHWERLDSYWQDSGDIEKYLASLCRVSPQRWHKWLLEFEAARRVENGNGRDKFSLRKRRRPSNAKNGLGISRELQSMFRRAARITPGRERRAGKIIPILTSESVLLAMARETSSQIGQRLASTGLDVERLERSAKDPKRAPIH
ncbi:MAG TPA: hypothetical protein VMU43_12945 [Candidatus Acidoferrum sp.]|nr:hypothetical protein [Candidatus Acidoferrum sp.]